MPFPPRVGIVTSRLPSFLRTRDLRGIIVCHGSRTCFLIFPSSVNRASFSIPHSFFLLHTRLYTIENLLPFPPRTAVFCFFPCVPFFHPLERITPTSPEISPIEFTLEVLVLPPSSPLLCRWRPKPTGPFYESRESSESPLLAPRSLLRSVSRRSMSSVCLEVIVCVRSVETFSFRPHSI